MYLIGEPLRVCRRWRGFVVGCVGGQTGGRVVLVGTWCGPGIWQRRHSECSAKGGAEVAALEVEGERRVRSHSRQAVESGGAGHQLGSCKT